MSIMPEQTRVVTEAEAEAEREEDTPTQPAAAALVVEDLLVEDVSIDGMCGVY